MTIAKNKNRGDDFDFTTKDPLCSNSTINEILTGYTRSQDVAISPTQLQRK